MTLSPDYYAAIPVKEIQGDAYDALRTVWPAAYEAMTCLLASEDAGHINQSSSYLFDLSLFDLIREHGI